MRLYFRVMEYLVANPFYGEFMGIALILGQVFKTRVRAIELLLELSFLLP